MPFDQYRTVVAALDRLTTQVRRVADAMPTPVDDGPTTDDDALRDRIHTALTTEHYRRAQERIEASPEDHCAGFTNAVMPIVQPLTAELARIRRALDPDDETYIRETVDEQFRLDAKIKEQGATNTRLATTLREVLGGFASVLAAHDVTLLGYDSPRIDPATYQRWRAALTPEA